jgi:hypothetical protein
MTMNEAYHTMLEEAGICPYCKEHKPCGCELEDDVPFDYADEKRRSESE